MNIIKQIKYIKWLLSAINEHNQIIKQDIKAKLLNNIFISNKSYQKFSYSFSSYFKLIQNVNKYFQTTIDEKNINYFAIKNIYNIYLNRAGLLFKESGIYLKQARNELLVNASLFSLSFVEMKQIANGLENLQRNICSLISSINKV